MIYTIEEIKEKVNPILVHTILIVWVFGSYARSEATEESDVDFVQDLEDIFHCHVDVVTTDIEDKSFLELIKKEGVLPYEKK